MVQVKHRHWYKPGPFGGTLLTTYCGRVRNQQDYNVAEDGQEVTCLFCKKRISEQGEPKHHAA